MLPQVEDLRRLVLLPNRCLSPDSPYRPKLITSNRSAKMAKLELMRGLITPDLAVPFPSPA